MYDKVEAPSVPVRGLDVLTNSRIASFKQCRRKHYFAYHLAVRRAPSEALRIGGAVHMGLDILKSGQKIDHAVRAILDNYATLIADAVDDEYAEALTVECEKCIRLVQGWEWRWSESSIEVVATELGFGVPIINPQTRRATPIYRLRGKIDAIVRMENGELAILEHKTTGESIDAESDYWKRQRLDSQISLYMIAAKTLGYEVTTVLYDVIHKPTIRPKRIAQTDEAGLKIVLDENGDRVLKSDGMPRQSADAKKGWTLQTERETVTAYGERLIADIYDRPDYYYARVSVPRLASDLEAMREELWDVQQDIRAAELNNNHYRNSGACMSPYPCEYLDVCSHDTDLHETTPRRVPPSRFLSP